MSNKISSNLFYDYSRILTYNAFLNILIGERGVGKTYGASKLVVKKAIQKKEQFAYIRRYKTELKKSVPKFFEALKENDEFPKYSLYTKGNVFYLDDEPIGYAMSLSTAQSLKGTNFSKVKYIIFDEFIIEKGQQHYLPNEVENFLGLLETIARMRDIKVFMLANAVTTVNPYFLFFNIDLPYNNDIKTYKDGLILIQYMKNEEYRQAKRDSKFGKLIEGTDYEAYAIDNKFRLDNNSFIEKKTGNAKCNFSFQYKEKIYGVWFDYKVGKIFVSYDYDSPICFACTLEDHSPNTMFFSIAKDYNSWRNFIKNYKLGNVYFESQKIKIVCQELIKNLIT